MDVIVYFLEKLRQFASAEASLSDYIIMFNLYIYSRISLCYSNMPLKFNKCTHINTVFG